MPTPPKPVSVLRTEKKSHRTKAELAKRQAGEESLLTGKKLKEDALVKQNPHAHKEFIRMKALLKGTLTKRTICMEQPSIVIVCCARKSWSYLLSYKD